MCTASAVVIWIFIY